MAVFDGVRYSLSPSLSPTRRNELAAILDLNGAAPQPPYTHLIAPAASHGYNDATIDPAAKPVTDRWVDRSIIMGKRLPEQYYSPDPAMIFSGVVACATDLSAADLEVLSAGITALGGQWRVGLTRDVTHLFALRSGSDKYNTAVHFAPQTHMCILTPHWFDDAVRLGCRIPETPYVWPDPPVLRPGITLDLGDDPLATEGKRKRKSAADAGAGGANVPDQGQNVRVWADRRILLSNSLELTDGSRRAIEARIYRAGGVVVPNPESGGEDVEEKAVDECDVLITRWRSGKSYFKAARASLLIGTLSWLFSVESSGTLHSPLDSLLWYPTPRGGVPGLINWEISVTNYTGAARDYLKRLITLVGAKFTPSMSQTNKVLIAGFQPSPKTTRALSWSIPVVNHAWLEDCFVEWRALTVGLERYIVYPPGVDFGKILMTQHDGLTSSQSVPTQRSNGGAVLGGRGVSLIDVDQEEARDTEYSAHARGGGGVLGLSTSHEAATTADGMSMVLSDVDALKEFRVRPLLRAPSVKKTPSSSAMAKRGSMSTPMTVSAMGAFVDRLIELPADDDDNMDGKRHSPTDGKQRARTTSMGSPAMAKSAPRQSSLDLLSTAKEDKAAGGNSGESSKDRSAKDKEKGVGKSMVKQRTRPTEEAADGIAPPKPKSRPIQREPDVGAVLTDDETKNEAPAETSQPRRRSTTKEIAISSEDSDHEESEVPVPSRRPPGKGSRTPVKSGMKPRPRSKSQSRPRSVLGGESEEEARVLIAEPGTATRDGKRRGELAKPTRIDEVMIKPSEKEKTSEGRRETTKKVPARPRSRTRSPPPTSPKSSRTPQRMLSVVIPSLPKEYFSSQSMREAEGEGDHDRRIRVGAGSISETKRKQLALAASMDVIAAEASASTNKRGKPSPAKTINPYTALLKSKPRVEVEVEVKARPKPNAPRKATKTRADDGDTSMTADLPVSSTSRGGPRRSAANKATTRLRDEIMPDVVHFEKEQKRGKRRRSTGGGSVMSVREVEVEERNGKKRKVAKEVEEAEVDDVVSAPSARAKPRPINRKIKAKGATSVGSGEDMNDSVAKKSSGSEEKGDRGRGKELARVRLMTTGVTLLDDVIKRLTKLGVQMTTKPSDCTHLVAKGIVRTEKFLCAMSVSPWILTEEWANASANSGKLLPENGYLLSDAVAEQKWAFTLVDAMARAGGPGGGPNLFKQMMFYVTPKVSIDAKLFKNVVSAGGGQVQTSTTPTVRILNGKANRYVISCPADKGIWRPLMQEGFKIYSPELVLRGALRQEIEWESEECIVAGLIG